MQKVLQNSTRSCRFVKRDFYSSNLNIMQIISFCVNTNIFLLLSDWWFIHEAQFLFWNSAPITQLTSEKGTEKGKCKNAKIQNYKNRRHTNGECKNLRNISFSNRINQKILLFFSSFCTLYTRILLVEFSYRGTIRQICVKFAEFVSQLLSW